MYQLIANSTNLLRLADKTTIPADEGNRDFQAYLAWKAAGNTPLPAPVPDTRTTDPEVVSAAYNAVEVANLSPAGAVQLAEWCAAGNALALADAAWVKALYAERDGKLAAIERGEAVDPQPTSKWKPHTFREIAASL